MNIIQPVDLLEMVGFIRDGRINKLIFELFIKN